MIDVACVICFYMCVLDGNKVNSLRILLLLWWWYEYERLKNGVKYIIMDCVLTGEW